MQAVLSVAMRNRPGFKASWHTCSSLTYEVRLLLEGSHISIVTHLRRVYGMHELTETILLPCDAPLHNNMTYVAAQLS